jgi:hypothetical protein
MKNKPTLLFLLAILILGFFVIRNTQNVQKENPKTQTPAETNAAKTTATLVLDDGARIATYSGVTAQNAFEILTIVTEKEHIPVVSKQYDFGIFVQKIGDKESGTVMAWIYSVNGKSGEVAADKAALTTGDIVEWKYTKSIY